MTVAINYEICNNCGRCFMICPMDVYRKEEKKVVVTYNNDCMSCFLCEIDCPKVGAIEVNPRRSKAMPTPF